MFSSSRFKSRPNVFSGGNLTIFLIPDLVQYLPACPLPIELSLLFKTFFFLADQNNIANHASTNYVATKATTSYAVHFLCEIAIINLF